MRDVSRSGHALGSARIGGLPSPVSLGEILRARIRSEVADYNAAPGPVFRGLVQPADSVRHTDGYRMSRPRRLHPDRLVTAAEEAVAAGVLSFQVGSETVTELDRQIAIDEHEEILAVLERSIVARAP